MKQQVRIGVVCLARKTFDFEAASQIYKELQKKMRKIENIDWEFILELVIEIEDAKEAARLLTTRSIDALICISGTFALGHLILELYKAIERPILLWGLNELPYDGGKIRLNSACGINLNASNLYKAGVKNYYVVIGDDIDQDWLDAIRIIKAFKTAHVGIVGYRAMGFFNLDVEELDLYKQVGVLIDHYVLNDIFEIEVDENDVNNRKEQIKSIFDVSSLQAGQIEKVGELAVKIKKFIEKNFLTAIAIRCWPEFASEFGISPCAAMSILQSKGNIIACEGNVLGALSMLAHQAIGGETPYLADFSQVNFKENFALLWHCGVAPCNLWDGKCVRSLDPYFAGGKGVTADFVMKSGNISIQRIDFAMGEHRIFLQEAEAILMDKELKGTYAKVIFKEELKTVLNKLIENGIAHHLSVVYGDFIRPFQILAKIIGWTIIE